MFYHKFIGPCLGEPCEFLLVSSEYLLSDYLALEHCISIASIDFEEIKDSPSSNDLVRHSLQLKVPPSGTTLERKSSGPLARRPT